MLVVKKLTAETCGCLRPIADETLVGDDVILRIGRSGLSLTYAPLTGAAWRAFPPDARADPAQLCASGSGAMYAAFLDEVYAGCAAVAAGASGWADVLDIRVDASCRRRGVARALLAACERFALKRDMGGLRLTVSDQNPAACQFCEHCGFTLQGLDRMALILTPQEKLKPLPRRACALMFYRTIEKG